MFSRTSALFQLSFTVFSFATLGRAYVNYDNEFVDPKYALSKNFNDTTIPAQQTILAWAEQSTVGGPWSKQASLVYFLWWNDRLGSRDRCYNQTISRPFWRPTRLHELGSIVCPSNICIYCRCAYPFIVLGRIARTYTILPRLHSNKVRNSINVCDRRSDP